AANSIAQNRQNSNPPPIDPEDAAGGIAARGRVVAQDQPDAVEGNGQARVDVKPTREIVFKDGEEYIVYRRVQGGTGNQTSKELITVGEDGSLIFNDFDHNLNVSVDHGEHSKYYVENNRLGGTIVEFEVPKWFDDFVNESTIPQYGYKSNSQNQGGTAPKLTDITTPRTSIELPPPWIEWLQEVSINGRLRN
ncbi:MAG: hypothetical protein LBD92_01165, partial [Oscillospiraceae bacterium]|nr:hypothetical protein [Oscillospiraceae bacterium]